MGKAKDIRVFNGECELCGRLFTCGIKQGPRPKYCSDECRSKKVKMSSAARYKVKIKKRCQCCGVEYSVPIPNARVSKFCSIKCTGINNKKLNAAKRPEYVCRKCGKKFFRTKGLNRGLVYCSRKCAGLSEMGKAKTEYKPKPSGYRKRARHFGVNYQVVDVLLVFERDFWRCQICGKKTPKERRGTGRSNAPQLDHRVPLSKGGNHTYDNVQCSCLSCNKKKSNKNSFGLLPLFADIRKLKGEHKWREGDTDRDQAQKKGQSIKKEQPLLTQRVKVNQKRHQMKLPSNLC